MLATAVPRFDVTDIAPRIGSAIHADKATLLSGARAQEIRGVLERRA